MQIDKIYTNIAFLKGVGTDRALALQENLQIYSYLDLLNFLPIKYRDRSKFYKVNQVTQSDVEIQITGKIISVQEIGEKRAKRLVANFADETGQISLVWFQGIKWIKPKLKPNETFVIYGKPNIFNNQYSIVHPDLETLEEYKTSLSQGIQPIYSIPEKLQRRGFAQKTFLKMIQQVLIETQGTIKEIFPQKILQENKIIPKNDAFFKAHFPKNVEDVKTALYRLKFEELFFLQLVLLLKKYGRKQKYISQPFLKVGDFFQKFYQDYLPFPLTNAQKKVIKEIRADVGKTAQMNRLLQGDVGSGKTIVALFCMLLAADNSMQSCLMAPTEILATQHYHSIKKMLGDLPINIALLTGSTKVSQRKILLENLKNGSLHILIGTHAVLEEPVIFHQLGLAIIDEQHRFGVAQRAKLWQKNVHPPHILVMTATPIPRTLAMSLYGDLDISIIDELPAGRKPINTIHKTDANRLEINHFVKQEIAKGRQIYYVYPLIEESETLDLKHLMDGYEAISRDFPRPQYQVCVVHGKMKPVDKEAEMQRFINHQAQIMVATTVIEVGVNVPNASVMIIENAERFGLSQLHQLRGRVGRGAEQSYCILVASNKLTREGKIRIETMCRTNNGFEIAEVDLKLRGPGDILGTQQSGILDLKIASLMKDSAIMMKANEVAQLILQNDLLLNNVENQAIRIHLLKIYKDAFLWSRVS